MEQNKPSAMEQNEPSDLAKALGHAAVGLAAGVVLSKVLRRNLLGFVVGAALAVAIHEVLDAPVSQAIGSLGL